jgi:cobalt-zinc-cadmium efflux system outer membrane protein
MADVASAQATPSILPCASVEPSPIEHLDLPSLWDIALKNNPSLWEAAADVETARGQLIQASKYPNPRAAYAEENLGNKDASTGTLTVQLNQEIVTAGKRRLDVAIATRGTDGASLALLTRKFDVLTRIRRAYYDLLTWQHAVRVNQEIVTALAEAVSITRKQVEEGGSRPRTDLLRLVSLLREARLNATRSQISLESAWRQLTAELGVPGMPLPKAAGPGLDARGPHWDLEAVVQRVMAVNTQLKQAALEVERARLETDRARAEAVPNVTLGGGFSHDAVERVSGAIVSVETVLPVWDRKQGRIHEAEARWVKTQAAERATFTRLNRETAEALGRYLAARHQVEELTTAVLPPLLETLQLLRKGYKEGAPQVLFADVLSAEQATLSTRLAVVEARRALWLAIADLEGLMQLDVSEELASTMPH